MQHSGPRSGASSSWQMGQSTDRGHHRHAPLGAPLGAVSGRCRSQRASRARAAASRRLGVVPRRRRASVGTRHADGRTRTPWRCGPRSCQLQIVRARPHGVVGPFGLQAAAAALSPHNRPARGGGVLCGVPCTLPPRAEASSPLAPNLAAARNTCQRAARLRPNLRREHTRRRAGGPPRLRPGAASSTHLPPTVRRRRARPATAPRGSAHRRRRAPRGPS